MVSISPPGSPSRSPSSVSKDSEGSPIKREGPARLAPQTPFKRPRSENAYVQKILDIQEEGEVTSETVLYQLGEKLGSGDYNHVYRIKGDRNTVLKFYQDRRVTRKSEKHVKDRFVYILHQYGVLGGFDPARPNLHQATIRNVRTAIEDGFFLVEYIGTPLPPATWDINTKLSDLPAEMIHTLTQIKRLFQFLADRNIFIDLKRDNVGLDAQGNVKLYDWHEEPDEIHDLKNLLRARIDSFAKGKDGKVNVEIFNYLRPQNFVF